MKTIIPFFARTLALACGLSAFDAQAERWDFIFHNLHHVYEDLANGGGTTDYGFVSLNGSFYAHDTNHDGRISRWEVQVLSLGSYGFSGSEISSFSFTGTTFEFAATGFRSSLSSTEGLFYGSGGYNDNFYAGATSYLTVTAVPVPEPASSGLLLAGLGGLVGFAAVRRAKVESTRLRRFNPGAGAV